MLMMNFGLKFLSFILMFVLSAGDTKVELKLISYTNRQGILANGKCCDPYPLRGPYGYCYQGDTCDFRFFFCLGRLNNNNNCMGAWMETGQFSSWTSLLTFRDTLGTSINNPYTFTVNAPWPQNLTVLVHDVDTSSVELVEKFQVVFTLQPAHTYASATQTQMTWSGIYKPHNSELKFKFRVYCADNYYGNDCHTFCRASDSSEFCDNSGNLWCQSSDTKGPCPPTTTTPKSTERQTSKTAEHTSLKPSFTGTTGRTTTQKVDNVSNNFKETSTAQTSQRANHLSIRPSFSHTPTYTFQDSSRITKTEATMQDKHSTPFDRPNSGKPSTIGSLELEQTTRWTESLDFQITDGIESRTLLFLTEHFSTLLNTSSETISSNLPLGPISELTTLSFQQSHLSSPSILTEISADKLQSHNVSFSSVVNQIGLLTITGNGGHIPPVSTKKIKSSRTVTGLSLLPDFDPSRTISPQSDITSSPSLILPSFSSSLAPAGKTSMSMSLSSTRMPSPTKQNFMTFSKAVDSLTSQGFPPWDVHVSSPNKLDVNLVSSTQKLIKPSAVTKTTISDIMSSQDPSTGLVSTTTTKKQPTSYPKVPTITTNLLTALTQRVSVTQARTISMPPKTSKDSIPTSLSTTKTNPFYLQTTAKNQPTARVLKDPVTPDTNIYETSNHPAMVRISKDSSKSRVSAFPSTTASTTQTKTASAKARVTPTSTLLPKVTQEQEDTEGYSVTVSLEIPASTANLDKVNKAISTVMAEQILQCQEASDVIVQAADTTSLPTSQYSFTLTCSKENVSPRDILPVLNNRKHVEKINHLFMKELGDNITGPGGGESAISVPLLAGAGGGGAVLVIVVMILVFRRSTRHGRRKRTGGKEGDPVVFNNPIYGNSKV